jgi:hypothetical protein
LPADGNPAADVTLIDVAADDVIAAARVVKPGFVFDADRRPASEKICSADTAISPVLVRGSDYLLFTRRPGRPALALPPPGRARLLLALRVRPA